MLRAGVKRKSFGWKYEEEYKEFVKELIANGKYIVQSFKYRGVDERWWINYIEGDIEETLRRFKEWK